MIQVNASSITTIALAGALGYALLAGGVILFQKLKGASA